MLLLQQMVVLFILMILGFFIRKKEFISDETCRHLSWIVVNVANPALILSGSINSEQSLKGMELLETVGIAAIIYVGLMAAAFCIPFLLRLPCGVRGTYKVMTIFSNIGFMGFPVISAVYGNEALVKASVFLIPYNLLIYTYGILAMKQGGQKEKIQWKKTLNIGVAACVLAVILSLTGLKAPSFAGDIIGSLSGLTAPLSMMVIGASMVHINFKGLFSDVRLLAFSAIKLLVLPLSGLFLLGMFVGDGMMRGICLVMLSAPVGSMTAMLAQQYDGDYELASKGVAITTILSVATMPLVSFLTGI